MASMGLQHGVEAPNEGFHEDHSSGTGFQRAPSLGRRLQSKTTFEARHESLVKTIHVTQVRVVRCPSVDGCDCI